MRSLLLRLEGVEKRGHEGIRLVLRDEWKGIQNKL
jgi:hypothetical protein